MNTSLQLASLNVEALDEQELQQIEGGGVVKEIFDFVDKEWTQIKKAASDAYSDVFHPKPQPCKVHP